MIQFNALCAEHFLEHKVHILVILLSLFQDQTIFIIMKKELTEHLKHFINICINVQLIENIADYVTLIIHEDTAFYVLSSILYNFNQHYSHTCQPCNKGRGFKIATRRKNIQDVCLQCTMFSYKMTTCTK